MTEDFYPSLHELYSFEVEESGLRLLEADMLEQIRRSPYATSPDSEWLKKYAAYIADPRPTISENSFEVNPDFRHPGSLLSFYLDPFEKDRDKFTQITTLMIEQHALFSKFRDYGEMHTGLGGIRRWAEGQTRPSPVVIGRYVLDMRRVALRIAEHLLDQAPRQNPKPPFPSNGLHQ